MEASGGQSPSRPVEDRVYVAAGSVVQKSKSTLSRALQYFGGRFRVLHVQPPPEDDNDHGPRDPSLNQSHGFGVRAPQEPVRQNIYRTRCWTSTFTFLSAERRYIKMQDIGKGIAQLIEEHTIETLVTGAADLSTMALIKSTSAIFVNQQPDPSCYVGFICKRQLIYVREGDLNKFNADVPPSPVSVNSAVEHGLQILRGPSIGSSALAKLKSICPWLGLREANGYIRNQNQALYLLINLPMNSFVNLKDDIVLQENKKEVTMNSMNNLTEQWKRLQMQNKRHMKSGAIVEEFKEELRWRNGLEELLAKEKEALEIMKNQLDESQTLLENALKLNEELLTNQASEPSSVNQQDFLSEFSFSEIMEATKGFDQSLKIDEGEYGSTYKGFLCHIAVTIKMLSQEYSQFLQEVQTASKLRHPNLVNLIGVCTEAWALIYEYFPSGSLEDRLCCTGNTAPLSWQTRVCICTQTCAAVIFLHYHMGIAHGDLKPGNILLDTNFLLKLIKSGLFCVPMEGEHSFASDVYSFGLIVLQLLTGKMSFLRETVQNSFIAENFDSILDSTAGQWPFEQARELAHLALRCCDLNPSSRPELNSEVWPVLEEMRILSEGSLSICSGPEELSQPPPYFICPIYQEIMENPHVAADGFTYEANAIRCWFASGHDTSPMTNLRLTNLDLVPNLTLRSAIQDWLQDH